jgi:[protein-PII] uridylyltransferase
VSRPDLLAVAALLHDLGKGYPGDHTEAGVALAGDIARRMGYPDPDVAGITALVGLHLLLPDVATRRDLDDAATIASVATAVGSPDQVRTLAALTEADSRATGPAAWGPWKAELVNQLVQRVTDLLEGGDPLGGGIRTFPTPEQLVLLAQRGQHLLASQEAVTVITDDRPGVFSKVAGVLSLHGLDVVAAAAHSTDDGRALSEFRVHDPVRDETPWPRIVADLELALDGRLAVHSRVAERARAYARRRKAVARHVPASVRFDNELSETATVVDVHAPDGVGVLYRITRAMAELDLDIRSARVQTLGGAVVDAFYVRDRHGEKILAAETLAEVERAILHSLAE